MSLDAAPRRRARMAAGAVVAAVVAAGAGLAVAAAGHRPAQHVDRLIVRSGDAGQAPAVVPWVDHPAPLWIDPPSLVPKASHPPCTAADLTAALGSEGVAAGTTYRRVRFTNVSGSGCTLAGGPKAVIGVRADGTDTPLADKPADLLLDLQTPANLEPGESGFVVVATSDACPAATGRGHDAYSGLAFELADGSRVVTPPAGAPVDATCGLQYGDFGTPVAPAPESTSPLNVLRATIQLPDRVPAGQRVDYTVTLTNPTDSPVDLDPCPSYQQILAAPSAGQPLSPGIYYLNCAAAPSIEPGQSVVFAMRLRTPDRAAVAKLAWRMQATEVAVATAVTIG